MTVPDITAGARVLVTGPTGGLGRALVGELAAHRPAPDLVLLGRDPSALEAVSRTAGAAAGTAGTGDTAGTAGSAGPLADAVRVDLADLASVRAAGDAVAAAVEAGRRPPLTAVVLNAGLQARDRRRRSADGHELTFAVNVVAQHLLLQRLRPALAPGAHVVLLGSGTHYGGRRSLGLVAPPRWQDPLELARAGADDDAGTAVAGQRAYATSKLGVVLLAYAWQRREPALRVNVYDPGLMPGTGLARDMAPWRRWAWRRVLPALRVFPGVTTPKASARHLAALVLGEAHADLRGGYVDLGRATRSSPASYDVAGQDRLWAALAELTAPAASA